MTMTYLMDQVKTSIAKSLLQVCDKSNTLEKIVSFLEYPKSISHGDLCLPVRKLSYPAETNPVQLAKEISEKFPVNDIVEKAASIGIYINFSLNRTSLISSTIEQVLSMQQSYGTNVNGAGKTVVLDYSSPNIAKPFHAGHLRSTIIGNFLCNALKANGYHTVGINYLGDWGKQYGLLAVGYAKYGDEEMLKKDPIKHLFDVYVKINRDAEEDAAIHDKARELFVRMEAGDEDVLSLWRRFRDLSIEKYKVLYERLGISFDVYSGESFYEKAMKPFVEEMTKDNLLEESNGALISDLNEWKLGNTIVLKKDGTSTYIIRDIAAANGRFDEYKFDKMLYVVASAQELHLSQLFKVCELMKRPWAKSLVHVSFGMVEGMSTRRGNVVFLEDVIDDAKQVMHDVMKKNESKYAQIEDPEKTADTLAISAIMIQDMRAKRIKNYQFDMDRMTSFEGDTGPYLQYAHSRLFSIQRKYESASPNKSITSDINYELLTEPIAYELAFHLAKYPEVLKDIVENYEPCTLVNYLMILSHLISQSFDVLWVMGQEDSIAKSRLALIISCRMVLGSGLKILGIKPLERM